MTKGFFVLVPYLLVKIALDRDTFGQQRECKKHLPFICNMGLYHKTFYDRICFNFRDKLEWW
jgi:hypothetical protein